MTEYTTNACFCQTVEVKCVFETKSSSSSPNVHTSPGHPKRKFCNVIFLLPVFFLDWWTNLNLSQIIPLSDWPVSVRENIAAVLFMR
jgi:hypothetical protein